MTAPDGVRWYELTSLERQLNYHTTQCYGSDRGKTSLSTTLFLGKPCFFTSLFHELFAPP